MRSFFISKLCFNLTFSPNSATTVTGIPFLATPTNLPPKDNLEDRSQVKTVFNLFHWYILSITPAGVHRGTTGCIGVHPREILGKSENQFFCDTLYMDGP